MSTTLLIVRRFCLTTRPMISRHLAVLVVAVLSAVVSSPAKDSWVVREDGVGPVKVGMTLSQLSTVLHEKFSMPTATDEKACFYVSPGRHPGVAFMIQKGRLTRIDVDSPGIRTSAEIQVGDTEERALKVYGQNLKVEPHAYTGPAGHYLTTNSSDGRHGIRFETDQGKITMFYAGRFDAIQYIEGCQ